MNLVDVVPGKALPPDALCPGRQHEPGIVAAVLERPVLDGLQRGRESELAQRAALENPGSGLPWRPDDLQTLVQLNAL